MDLSGQIIVVTGSSGQLGVAYVKALLRSGAKVFGIDQAPSKIDEPPSLAGYVSYIGDITDEASMQEALSDCVNKLGHPTGLVNNAAIDSPPDAPASENGPFENYPLSSFSKVINVNVTGTLVVSKIFGGHMARQGAGSIVNIASIYGMVSPDQSIYDYRRQKGEDFYKPISYAVSKSSIYNLTRYLAVYWAKKGVRVNTLTLAGVFNHQDKQFLDAYTTRIPVGRMAVADDYVGPVLFLLSNQSGYMTGSNMVVDGGWTAI